MSAGDSVRPPCPTCHSHDACPHGSDAVLIAYSRATYALHRLAGAIEAFLDTSRSIDAFAATPIKRGHGEARAKVVAESRVQATDALRVVFKLCTGRDPS